MVNHGMRHPRARAATLPEQQEADDAAKIIETSKFETEIKQKWAEATQDARKLISGARIAMCERGAGWSRGGRVDGVHLLSPECLPARHGQTRLGCVTRS